MQMRMLAHGLGGQPASRRDADGSVNTQLHARLLA